jgi:hypothetical protein
LFTVPFVGPALLGDVAEGVPPLRDGPVVPLELEPDDPDEPPLVCAIAADAARNAIIEMATAVGVREFMKSPIRFEDELRLAGYVPF